MKALSVDDRDENLYFLEAILRSLGFEVVNAHNGIEALEILESQTDFDLIISDVLMPRMDGFQLCREIRNRSGLRSIPFVFYTGSYTDPRDIELARRLGAARYLIKPMDPSELARILRDTISQAQDFPTPLPASVEDESAYLRTYNQRLVEKLEEKVIEYERLSQRLQGAYDEKVREVTERLSIEASLRRSEERYRAIVGSLAEGILLAESNGHITAANESASRILGLPSERLRTGGFGASLWSIFDENGDELPAESQPFSACMRQGAAIDGANLFIRVHGGASVWLSVNTRPCQHDANGRVVMAVMSFTDVTRTREAEQRIREQAHMLNHSHDAIIVTEADSTIRYWNQGAEKLYGWTAVEAIGRKEWQLYARNLVPYNSPAEKVFERGYLEGEYHHVTKTHRELVVQGRFTAVRDTKGRPVSVLAHYFDISERKQLEEQFLRAQRLESIGVLAGGVAHDLNNILAPILLGIPVMRSKVNDRQATFMLDTMEASATRGAQIVRQILSFSRGLRAERNSIQVRHLLKEIAEIIQETFPRNIGIETDLPRALWMIIADSTQLHQVFMNLCVNARDAMPRGGTLTLSAENITLDAAVAAGIPGGRAGNFVRFSVSDSGTGIPAEILPKLFEPFFTTKEIGKGTGLGLSTVRSIVSQHDGFLSVRSTMGEGSTFEIYFPAAEFSEESIPEELPQIPSGKGELILVIDDEFALRHICEELLTTSGYRVITADNGQQGLALLREHIRHVAAIVTDLLMPGMTGAEFIPLARGLNPSVRIIAVSGTLVTRGDSHNPVNVLADAFLTKPFSSENLLRTVHEVLADHPPRQH